MTKSKTSANAIGKVAQQIKIWAIQAMFSDDELLDLLVLKGGNAMALIHQISARASVDLDFSLKQDFGDDVGAIEQRIQKTLAETFRANGLEVFDFKMIEKPKAITADMRDFWGGYALEFKLVSKDIHAASVADIEELRRRAINLGQGPKFLIDISRFEYVEDKQLFDFDGTVIYVYSPLMIVCEKLRAICQQMVEYGPIIKRDRIGTARPKDFVDIFVLLHALDLDIQGEEMQKILIAMFEIKRVPLSFLGEIKNSYDFHLAGFPAVGATVSPDFDLKEFDFYFQYVLTVVEKLKTIWDK
ncbi:nucleotidyl transferase AbiEii/AbiGii toxin family protein [Herbaspirillum sp. NPDC101396]|uniref:nucleotidyl transferase AbiEii/AbiGii toxin family protein n=1 Tax=Herbaspirillum sp. NPDC101396 TaxID=3364005 RepID=UPI00383A5192